MVNRQAVFDVSVALTLLFAVLCVVGIDRYLRGSHGENNVAGTSSLLSARNIYSNRSGPNRQQVLLQFGGSEQTEHAVKKGLNWLSRHQALDGSWSAQCIRNHPGRCNQVERPGVENISPDDACCSGPGDQHAMAQTGLALLAFQAGGNYWFHGPDSKDPELYVDQVKSGLDWIVQNQKPSGGLHNAGSENTGQYFMYEHGIATFAIAEACATAKVREVEANPRYLSALKMAIRFIEEQQHEDGGWRYSQNKGERSDTSVSGWSVLAIKTASLAGVEVSPQCIRKASEFFTACRRSDTGQTSYMKDGGLVSEATTGVGMLVEQFLDKKSDSPFQRSAASHLDTIAEGQWGKGNGLADYYLWYNCSLALFRCGAAASNELPQAGSPQETNSLKAIWDRWNDSVLLGEILTRQETEGCAAGSWASENSGHGSSGGRIVSTAFSILTLEVYYRFAQE